MLVTLLGIVIEVSEVQPENAYEPMLVTPLGMIYAVSTLPIAYRIRVVPSLLYKSPSIDI